MNIFTLVTVLVALFVFSAVALAARPPGAGNGGGGGGGGGNAPPDYGDLIIILRDLYGVPIPSDATLVPDPETGEMVDGGLCWQPLAFPSETCELFEIINGEWYCTENKVNPDCEDTDDEICEREGPCLVLVDQYTCGVLDPGCTQEVDFGRINEARSPEDVFQSQLEDVVIKLTTADCVTLDPAGRLVASTVAADETVSTSTIDSPLQNLAIYRQLMLNGTLGFTLPGNPYDTAARGLGAASDKAGEFNVDMLAYLNSIMGLSDLATPTVLDKICIDMREEVKGVIQLVEKCFLNYGPDTYDANGQLIIGADYLYDRSTNFGALPDPAYIPEEGPEEGWFEYSYLISEEPPTFGIDQGPIMGAVFDDLPGFSDGNIGGFAQAIDDTRAVIEFMHTNPVSDDFATPVFCEASGDINYDVSISDVSGLQVPKNVVDGSSDREFIVTVANAGPDAAEVTLTVTAVPAIAGEVLADLDDGEGFIESPFVFPPTLIPPGGNHAFSAIISVDIGERTTIGWTATAATDFDVNPANNVTTASSNVKVTGSGGRGRR
jgi:hypothetical protein